MHREADRAALVREGARHSLANPPGGVRRELEVAAPVELLDGTDQAENALLNQIQEAETLAAVVLGDRHDEAQVRLDHLLLGLHVALLDALGETNLVGLRQEGIAANLVEEELQRIGGALVGETALERSGLSRAIVVLDDLDALGLDHALDGIHRIGLELVLGKGLDDLAEGKGATLITDLDQALVLGKFLNLLRLLDDHAGPFRLVRRDAPVDCCKRTGAPDLTYDGDTLFPCRPHHSRSGPTGRTVTSFTPTIRPTAW